MTIVEATAVKVKKLMEENNISQKMLQEKTHISHICMNKLLLCKCKDIDMNLIFKIANSFDISIYEFFSDELFEMSNIN